MQRLIEQFPLQRGAHPTRGDGMCAMEMVAWLAGEPHSDEPRCACPVIATFVRACNDVMADSVRTRYLRPLVPMIVNTRAGTAIERRRGFLVLDSMVRRLVPAVLRAHQRAGEAEAFAGYGPITAAAHLPPVARGLEYAGRELRAAQWVLERAIEGLPPERYVAGVAQLARRRPDAAIWAEVAEVIERMAAMGPGRRPAITAR